MNKLSSSRRLALKKLASMTVLGAVASLRSSPLVAAEGTDTADRFSSAVAGKIIRRQYVNEVVGRLDPDRYRQCFSTSNWKRLRQQYDPNGMFHSYLGHS